MCLETDKGPLRVTLSIGIAETRQEPMDKSVEAVIQRADKAMYAAKAEGRNRIKVYGAEGQKKTNGRENGN
jgi:diguanylate cyclase (GGDEF)-like protein